MSLAATLQAATALANEYTETYSAISGMACAADHDPTWDETDEARLNAKYARLSELTGLLAATFTSMERDDAPGWHAFLRASAARLGALSRRDEAGRIAAEYEHDQWVEWARGALPAAKQPEIFARGIHTLTAYHDAIEQLGPDDRG